MPAALSSPKVRVEVHRLSRAFGRPGFHIYCPVCGHDDFHWKPEWAPGSLFPAVLQDAYYRAECMYRDHYPYGGDCGDWMSDGSEDV